MNIPSQKMPGYKHGDVRNRVFMMSQRLNMAELESGFLAAIKQNINILIDFEISHLKSQSLWIN